MEPLPLRFPGHGSACEADDDRGTDFGRCGLPGYTIVHYLSKDRVVCRDHYSRMPKETATKK